MATMTTPAGLERFMDQQGDILCERLIQAEQKATETRRAVDAYIAPVFARFSFTNKWKGGPITKPDDLYLTDEDCEPFYRACDVAHREHGHDLPEGHCPALIAEHEQVIAETALVEAAGELLGFESWQVHGDNRKKLLGILREMYAARCRRNRRLRQLVREAVAAK